MTDIKVLIADDHKMFRDGLNSLLEKQDGISIVGEAGNGDEVLEFVSTRPVDVILMDIDMGDANGIKTTKTISETHPEINVLVLSMHDEASYIVTMLDAGAKGYILKNTGKEEMIEAIKAVSKGNTYYSHKVSQKIIEQLSSRKKAKKITSSQDEIVLTDRELEVLKLIAMEFSNPEIAEKLFISVRTVDTHRRNLLDKLQLKNTAGLVKYAIKKNLIE